MYAQLLLESVCWTVWIRTLDENENIYNKITTSCKRSCFYRKEIEKEFGIPIVNKRISVTPIALVGGSSM